MDAIGGYFELSDIGEGVFPHRNGILLNSGRTALEYILRSIPDIKGVWLPYYTCDVVLQPLIKLGVPYHFYHISLCLEIEDDIKLSDGEYIIVNNYFGIKDSYILEQFARYGDRLIVDCAQAFFAESANGMKAFYSCRKYVGVADGGVAYGVENNLLSMLDYDDSANHCSHLYLRKEYGAEAGYKEYQLNEARFNNQQILRMSPQTEDALSHIDYHNVILRRRDNFEYLNSKLCKYNQLSLPPVDQYSCPMVYPFYVRGARELRNKLLVNKVFVASYWPNVLDWSSPSHSEYLLTTFLIPIPIDQRYGIMDMDRILTLICS